MIRLLQAIVGALGSAFRSRASLVAENLALRQQLAVLRAGRRPRLRPIDRAFWVVFSRTWSRWVDVLAIVKPATVIGWHRRGYARLWAAKSRRVGRPPGLSMPSSDEFGVAWSRSEVRLVDLKTAAGHDVPLLTGIIDDVGFSPSNEFLFAIERDRGLIRVDVRSKQAQTVESRPPYHHVRGRIEKSWKASYELNVPYDYWNRVPDSSKVFEVDLREHDLRAARALLVPPSH